MIIFFLLLLFNFMTCLGRLDPSKVPANVQL